MVALQAQVCVIRACLCGGHQLAGLVNVAVVTASGSRYTENFIDSA